MLSGITFGDVVVVLCVVRAVCATLFTRASQLPRSGGVHEGRRQTRDDERTDDEDVVEDVVEDDVVEDDVNDVNDVEDEEERVAGGRQWRIRPGYGDGLAIVMVMTMNQRSTAALSLKTV